MTRKDYIKFAQMLIDVKETGAETPEQMRQFIAGYMAELFREDNERFDIQRFYRAAGVVAGE